MVLPLQLEVFGAEGAGVEGEGAGGGGAVGGGGGEEGVVCLRWRVGGGGGGGAAAVVEGGAAVRGGSRAAVVEGRGWGDAGMGMVRGVGKGFVVGEEEAFACEGGGERLGERVGKGLGEREREVGHFGWRS